MMEVGKALSNEYVNWKVMNKQWQVIIGVLIECVLSLATLFYPILAAPSCETFQQI